MADPSGWLARFGAPGDPGPPDAIVLLAPVADGGPPPRVIDPVPGGPSRLLGRWRLAAHDDAQRTAEYVPDAR